MPVYTYLITKRSDAMPCGKGIWNMKERSNNMKRNTHWGTIKM